MKKILTCLALLVSSSAVHAQDLVFHHELTASIDPATAQLKVSDSITFPESTNLSDLTFSLHEGLSPKSLTDGVSIEKIDDATGTADKGMDQEDYTSVIKNDHYRILTKEGISPKSLTLSYAGKINHPVKQANQEYAPRFQSISRPD